MEGRKEGTGGERRVDLALHESSLLRRISSREGLLRGISCRDRVSPSGVTCKILSSTWSGNLISNSLNLRQASFNVEARSLFPYSVYEKEGEAHRLDAQMSHSSSWGSNLSQNTLEEM